MQQQREIQKREKDLRVSKEDTRMANKQMTRCSTSLLIREMESHRYITPVRKTLIKKKRVKYW
jgi:hypothetical protein